MGLTLELAKRDFIERYAGSILGWIWALIWPLVPLFIYIVIFGKFMGGRLPSQSGVYSYSIYVSCGLIPWFTFSNTVLRGCNIFFEKKDLISKINVSLPSLLLFVHISEIVTFAITMFFFAVFLAASGYDFAPRLLFMPLVFYLQQILAYALGLVTATFNVFIRDLKEIVGIVMQIWFWFTPLVYVPEILPEFVKDVLVLNPAFVITQSYHRMFVYNEYPDFSSLAILALISHALLAGAYLMFRRLEKDVRDFL